MFSADVFYAILTILEKVLQRGAAYAGPRSPYFHIDVNSAFLSWTALERLAQGDSVDLRTIPAIVGGDTSTRHGVVLAKSIPAKAFGITTGEPVVNALRKCPHLVMASPDHSMYREKAGCSWNICRVSARTLNRSALMNVIWIIPRSRRSIPLRKLPLLTFVILFGKNFILL